MSDLEQKNKLKVYYIANARMPTERAHGIQLAKMCEALVAADIDLELVVPRRKEKSFDFAQDNEENKFSSLEEFYGLTNKVSVNYLRVVDVYEKGRIGFYIGSLSFIISYMFYIVAERLRGNRGIVYTIDMDQFSFIGVPLLGVPFFVEIHDAKNRGFLYSFLFSRAKGIITISTIIKDKLIERFGIADEFIKVQPNGIDLSFFSARFSIVDAREKLGISQDIKIALYSGKFYSWKGLNVLVDMVNKIDGNIKIYVVGGDKNEFEDITKLSINSDKIVFVGHVKYSEMPLWYAVADTFVVLGTPKNDYSYFHTSPMKLFEYMASKRPIVAARTPANRQILLQENAIWYDPDNADDLAHCINQASNHSELFQDEVISAFEQVKQFTWDKRATSVAEFIKLRF
jgi:glycosyltransferase involved in cell wall biosynthesis